ncbi:MAG: isochorismatase family protein [Gemmatimonadota bacterium]|nr:isochorismatase family protein [Gemmatimonadota bacterium]
MKTIRLDVRYYHLTRRAGVTEGEFHLRTMRRDYPADRVALVLVDVWSDHYVSTHLQRGREITLERIIPVAEAFRSVGAAVIHAPSPDCAKRYQAWTRFAGDEEVFGRSAPPPDDWPPAEFRSKTGEYEALAQPKDPRDQVFDDIIRNRRIIPEAEPLEGDDVVVTGAQLHRLLKHRGILHLFYAGFAANMCVPFRDYGMRAMKDRGYDIVLVRDCTTAIEVADTSRNLDLSRAAVIDVEVNIGCTASHGDLVAACRQALKA